MKIYKKKNSIQKWVVISPLFLLGVFFISYFSLSENSVYFYTPKELIEKASELSTREVRAGGMVKEGTVVWKPKDLDLKFVVSDLKGSEFAVSYKGAPPDMFKEASGVVLEGFISKDGKSFIANNLLVKHSEEYRIPEDLHLVDTALVQNSIIKNQ